jgi:DNA topoisomerase-2
MNLIKMSTAKRLNPFEHAFLRPETYIGPVVGSDQDCWVFNSETEEFELRNINYNPGLERIFVEIKSNVEDNKWRSEQAGVQMKKIEVTMDTDPESETYGYISFRNDGAHIKCEKQKFEYTDHATGKVTSSFQYPAEVVFGEMHAGTNFENDDKRKTSGRNGMGAKTTNVFSKFFEVEHSDPDSKKLFKQTYTDNARNRSVPEVTRYTSKVAYTKITFLPDYEYFKYPGLDDDLVSLFTRHLYDCSMITGIPVTLNGEKIVVKNLENYAKMYFPEKGTGMMHFTSQYGDECVVVESGVPVVNEAAGPACVSFVNGIYTSLGGKHVDAWTEKVFSILVREFNSRKTKKGDSEIKTTARKLYPYFTLFVRCESTDVKFDSQTKNKLVAPNISLVDEKLPKEAKEFNDMIREKVAKMLKWSFVSLLEEKLEMEADATSTKKEKAVRASASIAFGKKATEANNAGKKNLSEKCTLFITEGDSAKSFADTIISKMKNGRDFYGSFAIKGKFINVQKETTKRVNENKEVQMLKKILNLAFGVDYSQEENRKLLRYGKVCIISDADDDGIHIRGLLLNFFYKYWPQLFTATDDKQSTFFQSFSTAVTMVRTGKNVEMFYSNPSFKEWYDASFGNTRSPSTASDASSQSAEGKKRKPAGMRIEYYKGLGSHKKGDHELYLKGMHLLNYTIDGNETEYMNLGFAKDSSLRKTWIVKDIPKPGEGIVTGDVTTDRVVKAYQTKGDISLSDFVYDQLIIYHKMTLKRAIPNMYDGFKESQRKIFFGIQHDSESKKNKSVNVENLTGSIKKLTGYHHGAKSLEDGIKKMAMGFVGSNNIPLLVPDGEFGSRQVGGTNAAAARYIATRLEKIADVIFNSEDNRCYTQCVEDNEKVEYEYYVPVIPMVLVNGAEGMASGFSTSIPCYNPSDLIEYIRKWLDVNSSLPSSEGSEGEDYSNPQLPAFKKLLPWYRGFTGIISEEENGIYSKGLIVEEKTPKGTPNGWLAIREAPIGLWTSDLKSHLEYLLTKTHPDSEGDKKKKLDVNYITDFEVGCGVSENEVYFRFKPTPEFKPNIDEKGNKLSLLKTKISTSNMIVIDENGYPRKYDAVEQLISDFCVKRIEVYRKRKQLKLKEWKFDLKKNINKLIFVKAINSGELALNKDEAELIDDIRALKIEPISGKYEYLLTLGVRSCTLQKIKDLEAEIEKLKTTIEDYSKLSLAELWKIDLAVVEKEWENFKQARYND